jgi:AraC-like DNA-binding protein
MFNEFTATFSSDVLHAENLKMSNENRLKVLKAENYLSQFFADDFPGVEAIAKHVGISSTGIKTAFLQLYGKTLFGYHRNQKMRIALSILQKNKEIKIKELASQLGYSNSAKFSVAFKEEIGYSPSQIKSDENFS